MEIINGYVNYYLIFGCIWEVRKCDEVNFVKNDKALVNSGGDIKK